MELICKVIDSIMLYTGVFYCYIQVFFTCILKGNLMYPDVKSYVRQ